MTQNYEQNDIKILGGTEKSGFESHWNKTEFADNMSPQLDEIIESRVRVISFLMVMSP